MIREMKEGEEGSVKTLSLLVYPPLGQLLCTDPREIANIELVDFSKVLDHVMRGRYIDSALIIATLLVSNKKLLH